MSIKMNVGAVGAFGAVAKEVCIELLEKLYKDGMLVGNVGDYMHYLDELDSNATQVAASHIGELSRKPESAVWHQDESVYLNGTNYAYNDTNHQNILNSTKGPEMYPIYYEGQKSGNGDKLIKPNALFYSRKNRKDLYAYGGQIVAVKELSGRTDENPAKYQLIVDPITINGVRCGTTIKRLELFNGGGCLKKAALYKMGFMLASSASFMHGITAIRPNNY
mgnify:CR=1 FL=1